MGDRNREEVHIGRGPRVRIETGWLVAVVAIIAVAGLAALVVVMAFDSGNSPEPNPAAAPGSATPTPAPAGPRVVYTNDFEGVVGTEWSLRQTYVNPLRTHRFLGKFHEKAINLTLTSIPPHQEVTLSFDLYIIGRYWAGGVSEYRKGQDAWALSVHNGPTLLNTTFSNVTGGRQSYPDDYPVGSNPGRSGAVGINLLGYDTIEESGGGESTDTTYSLSFTFQHSAETLRLIFSARPYDNTSTWGLDNIVVKVQ